VIEPAVAVVQGIGFDQFVDLLLDLRLPRDTELAHQVQALQPHHPLAARRPQVEYLVAGDVNLAVIVLIGAVFEVHQRPLSKEARISSSSRRCWSSICRVASRNPVRLAFQSCPSSNSPWKELARWSLSC